MWFTSGEKKKQKQKILPRRLDPLDLTLHKSRLNKVCIQIIFFDHMLPNILEADYIFLQYWFRDRGRILGMKYLSKKKNIFWPLYYIFISLKRATRIIYIVNILLNNDITQNIWWAASVVYIWSSWIIILNSRINSKTYICIEMYRNTVSK